jgi:hypothetical protein
MDVLQIDGHVTILQDSNIILDQHNAIHPENVARIIAKSLANESNYWVNSLALGNGAVNTDNTLKRVNDGQSPDTHTWDSALHNKILDIVVDQHNQLNTNTAVNNISSIDDTDTFINTTQSTLTVRCRLKAGSSDLTFNELGLFSGQIDHKNSGMQKINVSNNYDADNTGLKPNEWYQFDILVNDIRHRINIVTPNTPQISYSDLINLIKKSLTGINVSVTT